MIKLLSLALAGIPVVGPLIALMGSKLPAIAQAIEADAQFVIQALLRSAILREVILIGLLVFTFMHGRSVEAGLQAKLDACLHPKAAPIAVVQAAVSQAAGVKHQAADASLQDHGRKVAQEIPSHVTPEISRAYPLPVGAVRVLNDAIGLPVSDAPGQPDDAASAVTLAAGVPVLADDINACRRNAQQLSDLQGWVRDQAAAASGKTAP